MEICQQLGNKCNGKCASIYVMFIPKKYENCYIINEYDGQETVDIDYNKYKINKIKEILDNAEINNDTKIIETQQVCNEEDEDNNCNEEDIYII